MNLPASENRASKGSLPQRNPSKRGNASSITVFQLTFFTSFLVIGGKEKTVISWFAKIHRESFPRILGLCDSSYYQTCPKNTCSTLLSFCRILFYRNRSIVKSKIIQYFVIFYLSYHCENETNY